MGDGSYPSKIGRGPIIEACMYRKSPHSRRDRYHAIHTKKSSSKRHGWGKCFARYKNEKFSGAQFNSTARVTDRNRTRLAKLLLSAHHRSPGVTNGYTETDQDQ